YQDDRYEYEFVDAPLSELPHKHCHTPMTMKTKDGLHLSLHEAALVDFASMTLERKEGNVLKAALVPWSDGVLVRGSGSLKSPWRTLQVADTAAGLADSHLILNLNEPPAEGLDFSWVEPGKYVGIWWEMHLKLKTWGRDGEHGATNENARKYIDFAAVHGFKGVLVEGWNTGWDGDWITNRNFDFTTPYPDYDLKGLAAYAREKGTRLIGHHETAGGVENYESQMDDAFRLLEECDIRAVKTGYVSPGQTIRWTDAEGNTHEEWHHGQYMVRHHQRVAELAAKRKVMVNAHEPIKDTGLRRTWPNLMTREGAKGQEFNAWGGERRNKPDHTTILPFTRLLSGPMDFTPGIFDLTYEGLGLEPNRVSTTLAKQLALYVIIYSPLHMAADLPENYAARPDAFQFIKDVPVDWEFSRVIDAEIGDYVVTARKDRNSDNWYLGAITDESGRFLEAPLGFLEPGRDYQATIYHDAEGADWETNPTVVGIERRTVTAADRLPLRLSAGGGAAVRFEPAHPNPTAGTPEK
ncbi:glycoside hydrolase family 97 catalytic domain-containing protein, partial [Haloferula sp.]|uniref:glycoside hydrolase family 97 protein n=1 Tax=Haloferula sp. TaxID=2497595 RepID=UPI003C74D657